MKGGFITGLLFKSSLKIIRIKMSGKFIISACNCAEKEINTGVTGHTSSRHTGDGHLIGLFFSSPAAPRKYTCTGRY